MAAFEKGLSRIEDGLHYGGCLALVVVAVLINADILLRLFVGRPVQIQFEVTELYLMPALATLSLARVFRDGGHISLEIVTEAALGTTVKRLIHLLAGAFFAAITVMSGDFALRAFLRGETDYGVLNWPLGWAYVVIPIGCGVLTVRLLYEAIRKGAQSASA